MKINNLCKMCRREGGKLLLKGEKCLSSKCPLSRRSYPPGQHGTRPRKLSDYGRQLREKQKMKRIYGVNETQFKNYYEKAARLAGDTANLFLSFLERRLDNTVYRLGLVTSRNQARQLISHRHVMVNNRVVNIPSYLVKPKDVIKIDSFPSKFPKEMIIPSWLKLDKDKKQAVVLSLPNKEEIDTNIDLAQIIEFYSR